MTFTSGINDATKNISSNDFFHYSSFVLYPDRLELNKSKKKKEKKKRLFELLVLSLLSGKSNAFAGPLAYRSHIKI